MIMASCLFLLGCDGVTPNNPYPEKQATENILYGNFDERPKYLDPARSYSSDESIFTAQIYETPLQYRYQRKKYELIPGTAKEMPQIKYIDAQGRAIDGDKFPEKVAETIYQITLKPGILYQPHPAFAKDPQGNFLYHQVSKTDAQALEDFEKTDTRELQAEDYVYEIKRIAWPKINSPIYELMSSHIIGLKEFHDQWEKNDPTPLDLRDAKIAGVKALDSYTYEIRIKGIYRQFPYWLAMPFFAPIPWEADVFYNQKELIDKNIVLDWYPVGTGPYMMAENNPNSKIVLIKNPNFRDQLYEDRKIPQIDRAIYTLEKEQIPEWNKFLQGYYDASGIDSDNFASAIQISAGQSDVTPSMKAKGISLLKEIEVADFYWGFNMQDESVGGYTEKQQKLRYAIAIAMDIEEYIEIFLNGRGMASQFFLPPGIFGYEARINPYVYDLIDGKPKRKSIEEAKKLLAEAGYPNGHDSKTNEPLIIHFDTTSTGGPADQARDAWMRKQFKKLGIDLDIRASDYNRFREKLDNGTFQLFFFGWIGDYPDPENFLFLLYGPNGKRHHDGVNSTNYENAAFDRLYEKMILLPDNVERAQVISQMRDIAEKDAPMVWGFNPEAYMLKHSWLENVIPNAMVRNGLKYYIVDGESRAKLRDRWNEARIWPLPLLIGLIALIILPVWIGYRRKEHTNQAKRFKD